MALIDELKAKTPKIAARRVEALSEIERQRQIVGEAEMELRDLDIAIAALEAPAQPVHPEAELRSVTPATEEDRGDQTQAFEIPPGFTKWEGGRRPIESGTRIEAITANGHKSTWVTNDEIEDEQVNWELDGSDLDIIAYRIIEAPEPEIPAGFTRWEGGEWTGDPLDLVRVIFHDEPTPYFVVPADELQPLWNWSKCHPDAQRIIAYELVSARAEQSAPEQDAEPVEHISILTGDPSIEPESGLHGEPVLDEATIETITDLWQQGYDDKANGYEPSLAEPEYTKGYEARALIEREHRETMERAKFFDGGMMADADRHQSDQRGIVDRIAGMFKREREDA